MQNSERLTIALGSMKVENSKIKINLKSRFYPVVVEKEQISSNQLEKISGIKNDQIIKTI